MNVTGWIAAAEVLERLRIRPQTLYAYVSRGRVQARPDPTDPRRSLYSEPDVERLARRRRAVRRPDAVAASAIAWGEPMLPSAISTVHAGQLIYRGADAVELSATATLEDVAARLWQASPEVFAVSATALQAPVQGDRIAAAFTVLAIEAARGPAMLDRASTALHGDGARLMSTLATAVSGARARTGEPLHQRLARGWRAPAAAEPLRRALVLLADHELNVSTFAARVTASSGASLPACVLAAFCALSGPRHGKAGLAVDDLVQQGSGEMTRALQDICGRGASISGFGHPLYAGADPRAAALLQAFEEPPAHAALRSAAEALGRSPNIDYALSALTARFGLPRDAPLLIFAVARSCGWIAHALEQVSEGALIRPRARYTGSLP